MTTYAGVDLLLIPPNARTFVDEHETTVTRETERTENPQGNVITTDTPAPPSTAFTLDWVCGSLPELTALRTFLNARRGQLEPCWIPSFQRDVDVVGYVPFFGLIVGSSEASTLLPLVRPWRYWFFASPRALTYRCDYFDLATDNLDGTHVWNTSPSTGGPGPIGSLPIANVSADHALSRLLYCRMARDDYRVRRRGKLSLVSADFIEIGAEAP